MVGSKVGSYVGYCVVFVTFLFEIDKRMGAAEYAKSAIYAIIVFIVTREQIVHIVLHCLSCFSMTQTIDEIYQDEQYNILITIVTNKNTMNM